MQVIRRIREETGAKVIIYNTVDQCDERVLKCRSMDDAAAPVCAAQEAMTRALFCLCKNEAGGWTLADLTVFSLLPLYLPFIFQVRPSLSTYSSNP